jgi:hypothetical protein
MPCMAADSDTTGYDRTCRLHAKSNVIRYGHGPISRI